MIEKYVKVNNLSVSERLYDFINFDVIPGTDINQKKFWEGFDVSVHFLAPKNRELLDTRRKFQLEIDRWHLNNKGRPIILKEYKSFLEKIGYLKKNWTKF